MSIWCKTEKTIYKLKNRVGRPVGPKPGRGRRPWDPRQLTCRDRRILTYVAAHPGMLRWKIARDFNFSYQRLSVLTCCEIGQAYLKALDLDHYEADMPPYTLCGTSLDEWHLEEVWDDDFDAAIAADTAEIGKFTRLQAEFEDTVVDLRAEAAVVGKKLKGVATRCEALSKKFQSAVAPEVTDVCDYFPKHLDERSSLQKATDLLDSLKNL